MATNRGSHFAQENAPWTDKECPHQPSLIACFFIPTYIWPESDRNEMIPDLKVEEALDS